MPRKKEIEFVPAVLGSLAFLAQVLESGFVKIRVNSCDSWLSRFCFRHLAAVVFSISLTGCMFQKVDVNATPATKVDAKKAQSEYWFNLPAVEHIEWGDYDALWRACEQAAIDASFTIERFDYRTGFLTTKPLISKQFFEVWKSDVVSAHDQALSDAATRRRVVHFEIRKLPNGRFVCEPKAVVEHYAMTERRITGVYQYRDAFSTHRPYEEDRTDEGTAVRVDYWYAERRDELLEHSLANRVRGYLQAIARADR